MPALPPVPNVLKLQTPFFVGTHPGLSHWYFEYSGSTPSNVTLSTICHQMLTFLYPRLGNAAGSNVQYQGGTLTDLSSASGGVGSDPLTAIGGRATPSDVALEAIHVKFMLTRRYRGGHPGVYLPPAGSSDKTGQVQWNSTVISTLGTDIAAAITSIVGITASGTSITQHVNVSYYSGFTVITDSHGRAHNVPKLRTSPLIDVVSSYQPEITISTQRRRGGR